MLICEYVKLKRVSNSWLAKKWNDPVWSKVISTGVLGLITLIINLITSLLEKKSFKSEFTTFWTSKIELWVITLIIGFILTFLFLYQRKFRYNEDTLKQDRLLFNNIRFENSMPDFFRELKWGTFSSRHPFSFERATTIFNFIEYSERSDFEFFHPHLEKLKKELVIDFTIFNLLITKHISSIKMKGDEDESFLFVWLYDEHDSDQSERTKKLLEVIRVQENKLAETFQTFITQGRKILSV